MPSGVVKYEGSRGVVWRIRYVDASGEQQQETLGRADEGWTKRRAQAALRDRQRDVEREGYRRPDPVTFATFAREWVVEYPERKGLKRSTREGYEAIVESHLIPAFACRVADVDVERIERYVAKKRRGKLAGSTVNRQLNVLSLILKAAVKRGLLRTNPVALVDRPSEPRRRWRILSPVEIRAIERAFDDLIAQAEEGSEERAHRETCRVTFLVTYGAGLRRGEILGLRWKSVRLADPDGASLRVEETFVRGRVDTPKSERSERTIALGPKLADELFQHRARTAFQGDGERVFVSPHRGSPLNPKRYAATLRKALVKAKVEGYVRPFHDGRHSSITNAAAAGTPPAALMARAGHSDFKTTQGYIDLAGETFRAEAERLEARLWGSAGEDSGEPSGTRSGYKNGAPLPVVETEGAE